MHIVSYILSSFAIHRPVDVQHYIQPSRVKPHLFLASHIVAMMHAMYLHSTPHRNRTPSFFQKFLSNSDS